AHSQTITGTVTYADCSKAPKPRSSLAAGAGEVAGAVIGGIVGQNVGQSVSGGLVARSAGRGHGSNIGGKAADSSRSSLANLSSPEYVCLISIRDSDGQEVDAAHHG